MLRELEDRLDLIENRMRQAKTLDERCELRRERDGILAHALNWPGNQYSTSSPAVVSLFYRPSIKHGCTS